MICQECGKRPATVHLTKIINNQKSEMHLCEQCARGKGEFEFMIEPTFSIHNLLAGLLDYEGALQSARSAPLTGLRCDVCGLTYQEFTRIGRLGCGECYVQFRDRLDPLLRRIHGGTRHTGKVPHRTGGVVKIKKEIQRLREELQHSVMREEFERAAQLRDAIRELERKLG